MAGESLADRARRKRRNEGTNWSEADELAWLRGHPEDRPDGWVDPASVVHADDLLPDIEDDGREEDGLQPVLDGIDILTAFERWGKPQEGGIKVGSKRESIMVRCPDPAHPDNKPSAYINLDKEVYHCAGCQVGGDKFDVYAFNRGYPVPQYKNNGDFPKMRREMAEEFGAVITRSPGGAQIVTPPLPVSNPTEDGNVSRLQTPPSDDPGPEFKVVVGGKVIPIDEDALAEAEAGTVNIDWESMVAPETFLHEWMTTVTVDDLPHEYYFWLGLQALGFAAGDKIIMQDFQPVKPNLNVCLYGGTGSGKSRAMTPYQELLRDALPFDPDPTTDPTGTKILHSPGSAEALLRMFVHEIVDPSSMKVVRLAPVRGLLRIEEFSTFVARSARPGSSMKETLIELYDTYGREISHYSLSGGSVTVNAPYCQVVTTTQPKHIHSFMKRTDADSGFMNRWVFAVGQRRRDRIAYGGVIFDLTGSKHMLSGVHNWASKERVYELTGDALQEWSDFFVANIVPLQENSDESMYSRIDLTLKKIMVLLAINDKSDAITVDHVRKATSLLEYLQKTYFMFSGDLAHSDVEECCQKIVQHIASFMEKHNKPCTRREVSRRLHGKYPMGVVNESLKLLEQLELITLISKNNGRGPATRGYVIEA